MDRTSPDDAWRRAHPYAAVDCDSREDVEWVHACALGASVVPSLHVGEGQLPIHELEAAMATLASPTDGVHPPNDLFDELRLRRGITYFPLTLF